MIAWHLKELYRTRKKVLASQEARIRMILIAA
jgi:hypothetical protein